MSKYIEGGETLSEMEQIRGQAQSMKNEEIVKQIVQLRNIIDMLNDVINERGGDEEDLVIPK